MTKEEFEDRVGKKVPLRHFQLVNKVYSFHPIISEVEGKKQVAELYREFGILIFIDMEETADAAMQLEQEITIAQNQLIVLKVRQAALSNAAARLDMIKEAE